MTTLHAQLAGIEAPEATLERPPRGATSIEVYRDNEGDVLIQREECEVYWGRRRSDRPNVHVRCPEDPQFPYPLQTRLDLANHSFTGFEWGYGGSGPAQLALSLLARATSNDRLALNLYQTFKTQIVASLDNDEWSISQEFILRWASRRIGGRS